MDTPITPQNCPVLEGWTSASDAARVLGVSRQNVHKMFERGRFSSLHKMGEKPIFFVSTDELSTMVQTRSEARAAKDAAAAEVQE